MINKLKYEELSNEVINKSYGKGVEIGMAMVTAFAVIAIITVISYKLFRSKSGNVTLPGGFKFKFTT